MRPFFLVNREARAAWSVAMVCVLFWYTLLCFLDTWTQIQVRTSESKWHERVAPHSTCDALNSRCLVLSMSSLQTNCVSATFVCQQVISHIAQPTFEYPKTLKPLRMRKPEQHGGVWCKLPILCFVMLSSCKGKKDACRWYHPTNLPVFDNYHQIIHTSSFF